MNNLIEVSPDEVSNNLGFLLTLLERGHTIKILQEGKPSIIMAEVPEFTNKYEQEITPEIPMPSDWKPDPVGVKQYVEESLSEMQQELKE